jgi:SseB protein N-terminal domain
VEPDSVAATVPPDVLLLPILPPTLDGQGRPVGEVQVVLARTPEGEVVAEAYTSPQRLVTARGQLQHWAAVRPHELADLLDEQDVARVLIDAGSPGGYALGRDGGRTPLPPPATGATTEEGPDATA